MVLKPDCYQILVIIKFRISLARSHSNILTIWYPICRVKSVCLEYQRVISILCLDRTMQVILRCPYYSFNALLKWWMKESIFILSFIKLYTRSINKENRSNANFHKRKPSWFDFWECSQSRKRCWSCATTKREWTRTFDVRSVIRHYSGYRHKVNPANHTKTFYFASDAISSQYRK